MKNFRKLSCLKCRRILGLSNFNKHFNSCNGKLIEIHKTGLTASQFEISTKQYQCPYCLDIRSKKGIVSHVLSHGLNGVSGITLIGSKRSVDIVNKIKEARKLQVYSEETRRKISEGQIKFNLENPNFRKSVITAETRSKIAKKLRGNKNHKFTSGKKIEYKEYILRSTWEFAVASYLDDNKINWTYEEKYFELSETTSYTPDFFIYDEDWRFIELIEVKGYCPQSVTDKLTEFISKYPDIKINIWNVDILKKLKIL